MLLVSSECLLRCSSQRELTCAFCQMRKVAIRSIVRGSTFPAISDRSLLVFQAISKIREDGRLRSGQIMDSGRAGRRIDNISHRSAHGHIQREVVEAMKKSPLTRLACADRVSSGVRAVVFSTRFIREVSCPPRAFDAGGNDASGISGRVRECPCRSNEAAAGRGVTLPKRDKQ